MIYKSYIVEHNINQLKEKLILFYGENTGLMNDLENKIKNENSDCEIIRYDQEKILKSKDEIYSEIFNISLFEKKIYLINQVSDKILNFIEEITPKIEKQKIYLFSNILERKSKIRNLFEKSKHCAAVACYEDNELGMKKIINEKLKGFSGLTPENINLIFENCSLDRVKLNNEIDKIKTFFSNKKIDNNNLSNLLDAKINDDFTLLRDAALMGDKLKTNKLLSDTIFEKDKNILYLNLLNQRVNRLKEVSNLESKTNLETKISSLKPPIFWKDKPNFIAQSVKCSKKKINKIQKKTYEFEIQIKSNSNIDNNVLMKKLIVDVCAIANS